MLLKWDPPILRWPERGPIHSQLTFCALDPDARPSTVVAVWICGYAEIGQGDALGFVGATAWGVGEGEEDGGGFVGAGGVFVDLGENGGGLS